MKIEQIPVNNFTASYDDVIFKNACANFTVELFWNSFEHPNELTIGKYSFNDGNVLVNSSMNYSDFDFSFTNFFCDMLVQNSDTNWTKVT